LHRVAVGQAEGRAPSVIGAVVRDGGQVWCGARSMLEEHEPDGNTQYRIGSLTKMFVAVLVMRLRDEGRLDLADPLGKYLDLSQAANVTIAQLLSHTAGLASETDGPWWERTPGALRPDLASVLGDESGRHPAGRVFHYSNPGFALLGALVGELRGQAWHEALRHEILEPLAMARTTLVPKPPHARGFAVHPWADVMQLEPAPDTGLMAPAGELWSTAEDLCRFAVFLLDGDDRILAPGTLGEMRTPVSPPADDTWTAAWGLGLELFRCDGRLFAGHGGSMPGFLAGLCVSVADGVGGVVLANATSGPVGIAADLVTIVADNEPRLPDRWNPLPDVDQVLLALTGLWYWGPRPYVLRLLADRALELSPVGGSGRASRFRAEPDGTWTGLDAYYLGEKLRLVRGADDAVDHLDLGTFIFTREPYDPGAPLAAHPDPDGWRAF
jgi:CubicO group peptidase (beta-lactamase class C family)